MRLTVCMPPICVDLTPDLPMTCHLTLRNSFYLNIYIKISLFGTKVNSSTLKVVALALSTLIGLAAIGLPFVLAHVITCYVIS